MHKISALLLSILLISITGCEDKKSKGTSLATEKYSEKNSEIFAQEDIRQQENNQFHAEQKKDTDTFILLDINSKIHKVSISDDKVSFHHNKKPIVLVNIFATWCPPCVGQLSYFNMLQKKYSNSILVLAVLTHDAIDTPSLKSFIAKHEITYFISNAPHNNAFSERLVASLELAKNFPIPLTVMYVEGRYFTHYEGAVPVEMIEYDIQQAQKIKTKI